MNIETAFERAYQQLPESIYKTQTGFKRIIGLLSLMTDITHNSCVNPLIHIKKDIENKGVIYTIQNTDKSISVYCDKAPDYYDELALSDWVKMEIINVEKNLENEFFKSAPNNPVQGKTY
ncbi:hypothetical protein [Acinetobacter gyllenbergii]|uniref:hypothetical protein n=1 Tax=Acinetobacter gyllenbergii TaxID=134534 RepID=UPI003F56B254